MDVVVRLAVALAILGAVVLGAWLARQAFVLRTRRTIARLNRGHAPAEEAEAGARILYFTSAYCVQCHVRQEPALHALVAGAPEAVRVDTYDAARDRAVAATYRILTAPSTVVIGRDGRVAAINHGFAPAAQLARQLGWSDVPAR
jgi:hypothetical protein